MQNVLHHVNYRIDRIGNVMYPINCRIDTTGNILYPINCRIDTIRNVLCHINCRIDTILNVLCLSPRRGNMIRNILCLSPSSEMVWGFFYYFIPVGSVLVISAIGLFSLCDLLSKVTLGFSPIISIIFSMNLILRLRVSSDSP